MAYTINLTNGTTFATVADGTLNSDSSLTLVGKNYAGYGEFLNDNFIKLLESGSNNTQPSASHVLTGQLWYDSGSATQPNSLKVYTGTKWQRLSAITSATSQPTSNQIGDLWWDTTNSQLKGYNGSNYTLIGPAVASGLGNTGVIAANIADNQGGSHTVLQLITAGSIVGIVSADQSFTPSPSIGGGFPSGSQIKPGLTLAPTAIGGQIQKFQGTATNAELLGNVGPTGYVSATANSTSTGTLGILNNSGLSVGASSDLTLSIQSGLAANIYNQTNNSNINIQINSGTVKTTAIGISGANANVTLAASLITNGSITTNSSGTAFINAAANTQGNIGSSTGYYNTLFATATKALYADLAERYSADAEYDAGTVVELGGSAEITQSTSELSDNVFGVISTKPAYAMNEGAGNDATHPFVALIGRVPVKVVGKIDKGSRLVSAGNGCARQACAGEATAFNVIGRSLESKDTDDVGIVEAIVSITK